MLRRDVAQELHRKAGVVFDDAIDFLKRSTLGPELDRAALQTFPEYIAGTRRNAADVEPMDVDLAKTDQRAVRGSGVDRRVHDRVVQMLALNRRVIAQNHVAALQAPATVDGKAVAHGHADRVGDEDGHAAGALRDQLAIGAYESDGEIFVLVDVGTESRARDVRIDLIGDRNNAVADHFEGDGIDGMIGHLWTVPFIHTGSVSFSRSFLIFVMSSVAGDLSGCVHEKRKISHFVRNDTRGLGIMAMPSHKLYLVTALGQQGSH